MNKIESTKVDTKEVKADVYTNLSYKTNQAGQLTSQDKSKSRNKKSMEFTNGKNPK
jgi:hypothetical protein